MRRLLLLLPLLCIFAPRSHAQAVFKQFTPCHGAGGSAACTAFGTNITAASDIIAWAICPSGCTQGAVPTDTRTNTYTQVATCTQVTYAQTLFVWKAHNSGAGADTVTLNVSGSSDGGALEYAGLASSGVDKFVCNSANASTSITSTATAATTSANELVLGIVVTNSGTLTKDAAFTQRANPGANFNYGPSLTQDKNVSSTGAQTSTATNSGANHYMAGVFTFAAATQPSTGRRRGAVVNN